MVQVATSAADLASRIPTARPQSQKPTVQAIRELESLKPTARLEYHHQNLIAQIERELEHFRVRCENLESELSGLLPRNAELEQASRNAEMNSVHSTVAMTIGGALISSAGFCEQRAQFTMLGFGGASVVWGAILLYCTNKWGWPRNIGKKQDEP
jgi:hypothetical protein